MEESDLICCKCNLKLIPKDVTFLYMGFHFNHTLPSCPACGQVFLPEELAIGKVKEVEMTLEEK